MKKYQVSTTITAYVTEWVMANDEDQAKDICRLDANWPKEIRDWNITEVFYQLEDSEEIEELDQKDKDFINSHFIIGKIN